MSYFFGRTDVRAEQPHGIKKQLAAGMAASLSQGLVRFLYNVLMGRILGVAALGAVNSAMSLALLLSLLWPTSAGQAATRFVAQMRGEGELDKAQAVAYYLGRRMLWNALFLAVATVGISYTVLRTDIGTSLCAGALLLGYSSWSFSRGVQYGAGQVVRAAVWDVIGAGFALMMLVLVLALQLNAILLLPLALSYGIYGLICWPRRSGNMLDRDLIADMNRFVGYGVLGTLSSTGLLQLSMVAAKLTDSEHQAGLFAAALSLATPATMLARTMNQVLFPSMAEAGGRSDHVAMTRQTDLVTRGLLVTMMAVFGALALVSPLLLDILYGAEFNDAANLLPIMLVAVMLTTLPIGSVNRLNSSGISGARAVSFTSAGGLLLAVILWIIITPMWGVYGVVIGYLVANVCTATAMVVMAWRADKQKWGSIVGRFFGGLAILCGGIAINLQLEPPNWVGVTMACVFLGIWFSVSYRDIKMLRGRGPSTDK